MTEVQWLASEDPARMLTRGPWWRSPCCGCLWSNNSDDTMSMLPGQQCCPRCDNATPPGDYALLVSFRKLRLFSVACWRALFGSAILAGHPATLNGLVVAERYADGEVSERERREAFEDARDEVVHLTYPESPAQRQGIAATGSIQSNDVLVETLLIGMDVVAADQSDPLRARRTWACLLREIVGNPFRPVKLCGLACADPEEGYHALACPLASADVRSLAQATCDNRLGDGTLDPVRLAVLSDALEETGCEEVPYGSHLFSSSLLLHLRSPGPHVRGCWALDLILGKE